MAAVCFPNERAVLVDVQFKLAANIGVWNVGSLLHDGNVTAPQCVVRIAAVRRARGIVLKIILSSERVEYANEHLAINK